MIKWFHNLKVAQKLALISVLFLVPDSIMLYLFITSINESIHFGRLEQVGNEYQRPLERLLELVPQHRLMARRISSVATTPDLSQKQAQIDSAFEALNEVEARIRPPHQFTPQGLAN